MHSIKFIVVKLRFLWFNFAFHPANDGVVVGSFNAIVHHATIGFPVRRHHDMVDAYIHAGLVIAHARPVTGSDITVGKMLPDGMMGIGNGGVIEVATEDNAVV